MIKQDRYHLFDKWADHFDLSVAASKHTFPFAGYQQVLDEIVAQADVRTGMQILDLGIGTGNLARRFVELGAKVWGIDFSSEMMIRAQRKLPQAEFVQADLLGKWPSELNRRFNRIVSAYVFHEFDLPTKIDLLRRLAFNHLSANGSIVIGDIAFATTKNRNQARKKWQTLWDEKEYYWVADETVTVCKKTGLRVGYQQISICAGVFLFKPIK